MSIFEPVRFSWTNRMLAVLRIGTGLVFLSAGTMKLLGFPAPPVGATGFRGVPLWEIQFAGGLETLGGLAIVIGLLTRPIALLLAGEMTVAYFQVHFPLSVFPTVNGGMPAVLYGFIYLYLGFAGPGAWSLDALIAGPRRRYPRHAFGSLLHARLTIR